MPKYSRLLALAIAVIVNSGALATMHVAMAQAAEHAQAAQSIPDRIVVIAHRNEVYKLTARAGHAPNTL